MPDIALAVLAISVLIVLVALLQPLATRLSLPHSVLIAALGIAIGSIGSVTGAIGGGGPLSEFAHAVTGGEIRSEAILHIFLPILLFEAGLHMDVRRMMDDGATILTLAVVAVLVCSLVVGIALWGTSSHSLVLCLLLGAIVATTDPAAVIGIFRDAGAPRRLTILVEGESLLNDAAAITLYIVLVGLLTAGAGHAEGDAAGAPLLFLRFFIGGGLFGFIAGRLAFMVMRPLNRYPVAEVAFTLALPYIAYVVAERYLHVSGVVAVVTVALVVGSTGRVRISAEGWEGLEKVWALLGFCASTLIFIFAAMLVPEFLRDATVEDGVLLLVLVSAAFIARAIVLWGLLPLLTWLKVAQPVSTPYRLVILWGGLRGAVTLALALAVSENPLLGTEATHFVVVLATGFVLWTLLINATTLRMVMRSLGLNALSATELALRDRALHQAREGIAERIEEIGAEQHLSPEVAKEAAEAYRSRLSGLASRPFMLDPKERERMGLMALANRERDLVVEHFDQKLMSRRTTADLLAQVGRLHDAAMTGGRAGYLAAASRNIDFGPGFRLAILLQRSTGWEGPLSSRIADRLEMLKVARMMIEMLKRHAEAEMRRLLGAEVWQSLDAVLTTRLDAIIAAIEALRLQYPDYERRMSERFLRWAALRLESAEYDELRNQQFISGEIYEDLQRDVGRLYETLQRRPQLDLGLGTAELVRRLPFFQGLSEERIEQICKLLKPIFAVPGETIVQAGDRGDTMYFISSGAVEIGRGGRKFRLGRGDFFGEMALLISGRRTATVTAIAFCKLLALTARDLSVLASAHPDLRRTIAEIARARSAETERTISALGEEEAV
ncbi:cation:proton antiporter [Inquilinus sp. Marseille-Q2685]|uniref:cation:proton antiporter n=1 Tax=Inquilinus sp. Marseille-Q2685 TaxID=2866581 RepID=UPI001CE45F2C|nr:cation:proton antiporter [Inquilinus sp. Marseille-Q2685]